MLEQLKVWFLATMPTHVSGFQSVFSEHWNYNQNLIDNKSIASRCAKRGIKEAQFQAVAIGS